MSKASSLSRQNRRLATLFPRRDDLPKQPILGSDAIARIA